MNELNENELAKVAGGAVSYDDLKNTVHTCPFCLGHNVSGGVGDSYNGKKTGWMACYSCGYSYEVYFDADGDYKEATDIYTKRWIDKERKLHTQEGFPDVQALWK